MRTRVAMFVFNDCSNDARVMREATALAAQGLHVRIFALSNSRHVPGLVQVGRGVEIHRLRVRSLFHALFSVLAWIYHFIRRTRQLGRRAAARMSRLSSSGLQDLPDQSRSEGSSSRLPLLRRAFRALRLSAAAMGRGYRRSLRNVYLRIHAGMRRILRPVHRPTMLLMYWVNAGRAAAVWDPDVVHCHDANTLPCIVFGRLVRRRRLVYDSHELWRHRNRSGELRPIGRVLDCVIEWSLVRLCDAVIAVSPGIVAWLKEKYSLGEKVHLLRNAPALHGRVGEALDLRLAADVGPREKIVIYTGRITSGRGIEETIDQLPQFPDLILVLMGYGAEEQVASLMAHATHLGVGPRVRLVDAVPPEMVPRVVRQADLAVVAIQPTCLSYTLALPNKLFEAIHAEVPVVCSDLPDMAQVVQRYGCGVVCDTGDPVALGAALKRVLENGDEFRAGATRAAGVLNWETEQLVLTRLYERLVPVAPARQPRRVGGPRHASARGRAARELTAASQSHKQVLGGADSESASRLVSAGR